MVLWPLAQNLPSETGIKRRVKTKKFRTGKGLRNNLVKYAL